MSTYCRSSPPTSKDQWNYCEVVPPSVVELLFTFRLKLLLDELVASPCVDWLFVTVTVVVLPSLLVAVCWEVPFSGTSTFLPFTCTSTWGVPLFVMLEVAETLLLTLEPS
jgi:hypothetical protein